ncbi:hypothetical protein QVD17_06151 [Tagetes erecta]|uniref:Uncharacterized protein n=1 Tax=Tagetes erecta TaxID=13708 RepID=A0AAD8PC15_TARER|nr:hypothetical protein QVD17_06151 [Tagetes erecta]
MVNLEEDGRRAPVHRQEEDEDEDVEAASEEREKRVSGFNSRYSSWAETRRLGDLSDGRVLEDSDDVRRL